MNNTYEKLRERIAAKQNDIRMQEQEIADGTKDIVNDLSPANIVSNFSHNLAEKVLPSGIAKNDLLMTGLSVGGSLLMKTVFKRNLSAVKKGAAIAGIAAIAAGIGIYQIKRIKEKKSQKRLSKAVAKARKAEAEVISAISE